MERSTTVQTIVTIALPIRGLRKALNSDDGFWRPPILERVGLEMLIERWGGPSTVMFRTVKGTRPLEDFSLVYKVGEYVERVQQSDLDWGPIHWVTVDDGFLELLNRNDSSIALRYQA
jgi:hypothetical protein